MAVSVRLQEFLNRNHAIYKHTTHPSAYTAREVATAEHLPPGEIAKVVIVATGHEYQMIVLPANRAVDLAELRMALDFKQARLATEQEIAALFPDCDVGAMPPFGNLYDMPVYADASLALDEWIAFNAGTHQDVVHMSFQEYKRLVNPTTLALSRQLAAHHAW